MGSNDNWGGLSIYMGSKNKKKDREIIDAKLIEENIQKVEYY